VVWRYVFNRQLDKTKFEIISGQNGQNGKKVENGVIFLLKVLNTTFIKRFFVKTNW